MGLDEQAFVQSQDAPLDEAREDEGAEDAFADSYALTLESRDEDDAQWWGEA